MRTTRSRAAWAALTLAAAAALIAGPSSAIAFDPAVEAQNFSKTEERQTIYNTPEYQVLLRQVGAQNRAAALAMQAADPERNFSGHLCASGEDGCAGDARHYVLSPSKRPSQPVPSCSSGTSHAAKQNRRDAAGRNAPYNPVWRVVNPSRIGLAGHSFGAAGVSYERQKDPRVSAIVALDNLGAPSVPTSGNLSVKPCPSNPTSHDPAPVTKPALGMSADYGLTPMPYTSDPDPLAKSTQSLAYSQAGVGTGEI